MINLSIFAERLEELIFDKKITAKDLSLELGLGSACISHYLTKYCGPTVTNLIAIADYFNCSTDYLLGLEDESTLKFKACPPFAKQIETLREFSGLKSAYAFYRTVGISKSCYYEWVSGRREPTLDNILKIAKYFDRRIDFILGREV